MLFISYRRSDTLVYADWIGAWLEESLPASSILYARDSIGSAVDWQTLSTQIIPQCKGMIVLIGSTWLSPRLFEPNDAVRQEIQLALEHQIPIIPVLVQGAVMPNFKQLPEEISELSRINAIALRVARDSRKQDWEQLRKTIERKTGIMVRAPNFAEADKLPNTLSDTPPKLRIFVSHSHMDNDWCICVVDILRSLHYDVWFDKQGLYAGAKWIEKIEMEIESCSIFMPILTPSSLSSRWVKEEIQLALELDKLIVGVFHQYVKLEGFLRTRQMIDVVDHDCKFAARIISEKLSLALSQKG